MQRTYLILIFLILSLSTFSQHHHKPNYDELNCEQMKVELISQIFRHKLDDMLVIKYYNECMDNPFMSIIDTISYKDKEIITEEKKTSQNGLKCLKFEYLELYIDEDNKLRYYE